MSLPVVPENSAPKDPARLPWTVLAATLVAVVAYHLTAGFQILTVAFTLGIVASLFTDRRLEGQTSLRWWLRLGLLLVVLALNQEEPRFGEGIGNVKSRNIFGQVYLAEMLVQAWRRRDRDPYRSRVVVLVLSGLLFLIGSNTFETTYIRWMTPVYITLAALGLYEWRDRLPARRAVAPRVGALLVALFVGFGFFGVITANKASLTEWGNRIIVDRVPTFEIGMMAQPTLGMMFGLRGSPARVLRIEDFTGDDHLRGMAFDSYTTGRWSPTFIDRPYRPAGEELRPEAADRILNSKVMRITRMINGAPLLYAPLNAASLDTGEAADVDWARAAGGPIRTRANAPYEYGVTVPPPDQPRYRDYQGLLANELTPETRERCLQVPPYLRDGGEFSIRGLAERITAGARDDREKAERVTAYLISNHSYSLNYRGGRGDALADFLLSEPKKSAHCEFFGSAAAMLLRCVGVPTRYVTGYYAHEKDGPYIVVRQRDAHAWCEAWVEGVGWITVEATPGDGRPDANDEAVEWWRRLIERVQDGVKAITDWIGDLGQNAVNAVIGLIIAIGLGYGAFVYLRRRRAAVGPVAFAYSSADARLAALTARFEAAFSARGVPVVAYRTYADHLRAVAESTEPPAPPVEWTDAARAFVRDYDRARFGGRADAETLDRMEHTLRELETPTR